MKNRRLMAALAAFNLFGAVASADDMAGMDMSGTDTQDQHSGHDMAGMTGLFGSYAMTRDSSGTSWQPDAASHGGIQGMAGDWSLMGHVRLTAVYDSQSGPRGDDGFYLNGMLMGQARRDFSDNDTLAFRVMLSPDPFGGRRGYPLLLQTGETADGTTPLMDRQHPHDLVMELAAAYSHRFDEADGVFVYGGYPGEPALGPPAFMHRPSSIDMPAAPLAHHWLDSTHITFGVVTAGFVHDDWKLEVSQFSGREPDQYRFDFDKPTFDSTAVRLSWNPDEHWALQVSGGFLNSPEQLTADRNEIRYTASAIYVLPLGAESSWSSMLAWGRKHLTGGTTLDSLLLETEYKPDAAWTLFARTEWIETDEPFASPKIYSFGELSLGAIHDWRVAEHAKIGLGAQYAFDFAPSSPAPSYGSDPHGTMVFARLILE